MAYAKNRHIDQTRQIAKEVTLMQLLVEGERFIYDNRNWGDLLSGSRYSKKQAQCIIILFQPEHKIYLDRILKCS